MSKYKSVLFYLCLFFIFLIYGLIIYPVNLDEIWNYGFAHNIASGLIPYKDFNMVITPFYPFLMALPLLLFGSNMLVFHISNALLLTVLTYFLFKLFGNKSLIIILFLFLPFSIVFPSYNVFLFILLVIIIYCEKNNINDYIIGLLLALCCLTKQSVGICMLFPSLFYWNDKKKLFKRCIGFIIPCILFLIYLLCTNSFYQFFDLCLFGLFDFASGNGKGFNRYWIYFILIFCYTVYRIFKEKNNILYYYVLAFYSILIPLFDTYHFQVLFLGFLLIVVDKFKFFDKLNLKLLFFGIIIGISFIMFYKTFEGTDNIMYPNDIRHFEYRLLDGYSINVTKEVNKFINKNKDRNFVFLCSNGYYFRIVNDMDISYVDLINTGNWGYNGEDKLFNTIMSVDNPIFIVNDSELSEILQTDKKIIKYVLNNGKKIESIYLFDIYVIE